MKTSIFGFGLLAVAVVCLLNIVMSAGCVTKPADCQSSFKLEGLEHAVGPETDTPIIY